MDWNKIAKGLATAGLPTLGSALAGPAGAQVGALIARRIGAAESDPAVIAQAIEADPETMIALRQLDAEMAKEEHAHIERVLVAEEAATAADQVRVATVRPETMGHWLTPILSVGILTLFAAFGAALFFVEPPSSNRDMVNIFLGALFGFAGAAVTYWLGSSRGSADRSATIDQIAQRK
jgi:hypothetical protein